ncbi:helicase-related protein [Streptomyces kaniharaensis]|uniref:helicase-related protein n=1 Tax=Streptomyces kaniharaensis TaxID=212423 RepID=UPI001295B23C|nr:helicase-related protein [Streptomyces kaniharaensis]
MRRAVADLGLRRVITFHSRVSAAREFANTPLDASELLPDAERPERIWAKAVAGTDRLKDRRAAFTEFKAHTGEDGEECGILANARLLSEGIDVRAVDAICFADPKSSVIDIVQAVSRRCASPTGRARCPGSSSRSTSRPLRSVTTLPPRTRPRVTTPARP